MSEPTAFDVARPCPDGSYCNSCDLLVGLEGFHVVEVAKNDTGLRVVVESPPRTMGCPMCGVVVFSHGRREVRLIDVPCFRRPVELIWRKRTWRCGEPACAGGSFTEQHDALAEPRALLTTRARWWAVAQLRREHASVRGLTRQLGTTWNTVWGSIKPLLEQMAADETRFAGVQTSGSMSTCGTTCAPSRSKTEDGGRRN